jgi:acetolactate synthase-1/3 small subunit
MTTQTDTQTMVLKVRDIPGVLVRVAHIFARRGYNIKSLHVEPVSGSPWSTMTIVMQTAPRLEQVTAQLEKLVDVFSVKLQAPK